MENRINRYLQFSFGLGLVILVAISIAAYINIQNLIKSAELVNQSNRVMINLENIVSVTKDAETGQRGFLLTDEDEFLEPYKGAYQKALSLSRQFGELTADNPAQQLNANDLKVVLLERLNILQQLLDKRRKGKVVTIDDLRRGKKAMDALRALVDKAKTEEKLLLDYRIDELSKYNSLTPAVFVFAAFFAFVVAIFSYIRITKDITQRERLQRALQWQEKETASMNEELATANEELIVINEEYLASNEELLDSRKRLELLNIELEERVVRRTRELFKSENRLRKMMECLPQIAWTNKPDGEVDFYNQRWFEYTGLDFEQTKAWGWKDVIHPDDLQHNLESYQDILNGNTGGEFEIREMRKDGLYRWHLVRMMPVQNEEGEVQLWVGTATDIEELKQLQQKKDDFISIASHELKTPITILKTSLQMLLRMKDNPGHPMMPDMIERANGSLNRLNTLIEDLLNVSKMSQGQLHLSKSLFTISKIIDECCTNVRMLGEYTIITTGNVELKAYGDPERIDQVVVNFVNNAIKYAPANKEITVNIEKIDNWARISVSDTGPGIAPEKIPHLFNRYYRVDSHGSQYSGLGLGLYICSEIIKKHNGQIGVESELGKGSSFWFMIPLRR